MSWRQVNGVKHLQLVYLKKNIYNWRIIALKRKGGRERERERESEQLFRNSTLYVRDSTRTMICYHSDGKGDKLPFELRIQSVNKSIPHEHKLDNQLCS